MSEETLISIGSPTEVKEQIKVLLSSERLEIFVQDYPVTHVITEDGRTAQIINPVHFTTYNGISVLCVDHGWGNFEKVSIKEDEHVSLEIHQYQTVESALWYVVILVMEMLNPEASRHDVAIIAKTLSEDPEHIEEMKYLLATEAGTKGNLNDSLPLAKLILSNQ